MKKSFIFFILILAAAAGTAVSTAAKINKSRFFRRMLCFLIQIRKAIIIIIIDEKLVYVQALASLLNPSESSKSFEIHLNDGFNGSKVLIVDLYSNNRDLFDLNAVFQYSNGGTDNRLVKMSSTNLNSCLFHGEVRNQTKDSLVALSTCDGLVRLIKIFKLFLKGKIK